MVESKRELFEDRLKLTESLRISVRAVDGQLTEQDRKQFQFRAENVLTLLAANNDVRDEPLEADSPFAIDMQRIEAKMDVLLTVFSDLLLQLRQRALPEPLPVQLNGVGVAIRGFPWNDQPQRQVVVSIHFDECPALPLELPALFSGMTRDSTPQALFIFENPGAKFDQAMETYVFRRDRRKIAQRRSAL